MIHKLRCECLQLHRHRSSRSARLQRLPPDDLARVLVPGSRFEVCVIYIAESDVLPAVYQSSGWPRTKVRDRPLMSLASRPAYDPWLRTRQFPDVSFFPRVSFPSALEVVDSDPRQACLPWLCCVFRVSHPLDAFFRPTPFRPCFVPVTPLGFPSSKVSLRA